jgi:hypothetical protein
MPAWKHSLSESLNSLLIEVEKSGVRSTDFDPNAHQIYITSASEHQRLIPEHLGPCFTSQSIGRIPGVVVNPQRNPKYTVADKPKRTAKHQKRKEFTISCDRKDLQ